MAAYVTSAPRHVFRGAAGFVGIALLGLAACSKLGLGNADAMGWARASLERNDRLEIVATDEQSRTFTVRVKGTGELRVVRIDQIVGDLPGIPAESPTAVRSSVSTNSAITKDSPGVEVAPAAEAARAGGGAGAAGAAVAPGPGGAAKAGSQAQVAGGPAASAAGPTTSTASVELPAPSPPADAPTPGADVASITPGGRVLEAGPGYAIKMAAKSNPATRIERERSATTTAAMEVRHDPIVCQGARLLQIDNRNLAFDGDAVSAEDGCEIHITNSHISAKGVGVSARAANVHIDNSQIEGDTASIDASDGAQVYASSSRFRGMSRRLDNSSFHDLGGNVWN